MFRRTVIITGLVLALACASLMAQGQRRKAGTAAGRGKAPAQQVERLQKKLNLNESQRGSVRALEQNRRKELKSLRQELRQQGQDRSQQREKAREINERFRSGIRGLLTPEQLPKLPKRFQ